MEEELQEIREMPFGRKYRAGNFEVLKVSRSLSRFEMKRLRDEQGIPPEIQKHLRRGSLPYIVVSTVSGIWSVSFTIGNIMYSFIENEVCDALDKSDDDDHDLGILHNLFTMMYCDTCILGDGEYLRAKAEALKSFMERQKADEETEESKKEDDEVLDSVRRYEEMIEDIQKEESNESK